MATELAPYITKKITGCKNDDHRLFEGDEVTYEITVHNPGVDEVTGTLFDEVYDFLPVTAEWEDSAGLTSTDLVYDEEITIPGGGEHTVELTLTVTELDDCENLTFKNVASFTPTPTDEVPCPEAIEAVVETCYFGAGDPKWNEDERGSLNCNGFWESLFPDVDERGRIAKMCDLLNACKPVEALLAGSGLDGSNGADGGGGNGEGGLTEAEVKALIEACLDPENADGKAIFMALLEACLATDNPDGKALFTAMLAACLAPDNADGKALFTAMIAACLAPDNAEGKAVFAAMLEACMTPDNPEIKTAFEALLTTCLVPGNENVKAAFAALLVECLDKTFLQEVIAGEADPAGDSPSDTLAAAIKAIVTNCVMITDGPIDGLDYSGTAAESAEEGDSVITILAPDGTVLSATCIPQFTDCDGNPVKSGELVSIESIPTLYTKCGKPPDPTECVDKPRHTVGQPCGEQWVWVPGDPGSWALSMAPSDPSCEIVNAGPEEGQFRFIDMLGGDPNGSNWDAGTATPVIRETGILVKNRSTCYMKPVKITIDPHLDWYMREPDTAQLIGLVAEINFGQGAGWEFAGHWQNGQQHNTDNITDDGSYTRLDLFTTFVWPEKVLVPPGGLTFMVRGLWNITGPDITRTSGKSQLINPSLRVCVDGDFGKVENDLILAP